jgi:hypothetical protein
MICVHLCHDDSDTLPAGACPGEQWRIILLHTEEKIEEHSDPFKDVGEYAKKFGASTAIS